MKNGPKETRVYDGAGERIIRELPPGLYLHVSLPYGVVRIDRDHRARIHHFCPDGGRQGGRPYRGNVFGLARAAFEGIFLGYMGWDIPDPADRIERYEEARTVTPWAYEALERKP